MAIKDAPKVKQHSQQPEPVQSGSGPMELQLQINALQEQVNDLTKKIDEHIERLDAGAIKIEEAQAQGKDVSSWTDYWIKLLHEYEALSDQRSALNKQIVELLKQLAA